ncbi:MAG: OmpA family protein [Myxococcota bacterium]
MKPWSTPWRRLPERAALALALLALALPGCVTRSTHNEVVGDLEDENARLEQRVRDLTRSNQSLDQERVRLIDEMEDLRQEHATLSEDVEKLSRTKDLLSEHLREREAQVAELSKATATYRGLVDDLESEVSAGQIEIEQLREGIRLNLAQDILFRSGESRLEGSGVAVLRKVAAKLRTIEHTVEVRGHTDDVPLSPALARRYGSNWELAAARASSVVRLFVEEGVDPTRLTAVSYGEFAPVAPNDTPEGRAYNRRIDIRLIPVDVAPPAPEPAAAEDGASAES